MLNVNDRAPEILGRDENGNEIKLSDFKGKKLVLYFYPKDLTSGCTTEACNRLLADLVVSGLAVPHTVIVLERSTRSDDPTPPEGWQVTDRRDYGETAVHYIEAAV